MEFLHVVEPNGQAMGVYECVMSIVRIFENINRVVMTLLCICFRDG